MAATLDPHDRSSWYFGQMSRQDATDLLMSEREGGVFLVRDSTSIQGDYVLCVREDNKVSHYIINKMQKDDQVQYRIGDQKFPDLASLLAFYKCHYLDTTPLVRPAPKRIEKVTAKYDFEGRDAEDLPFKRGEVLTIISKDEEQWWTARNSVGNTGSIPVPYVQKYEETPSVAPGAPSGASPAAKDAAAKPKVNLQRQLPADARVNKARVPNAYDKTALKLEVGDIIKVTKMNINGQWEGELNGKHGHFPFTHVDFVQDLQEGDAR
ncbi:adapter molecule Crk-like [Amphibalanus amphitrite]|uniref:adapter molecule Crk-like n=1 Tax=Amphibalanus amphitrite TaxID=1232801 RepID=UPI001C909B65|nr:adapter molecule Crk-like [Amphibalanus amphitrite]XP_043224269.1 adapter molecule Crk-like [Amphibalanus amphitrite]XP_043224270.1 adapter molecule Crk-like [Amphibalanus amphitrite]